jgi:hypothetical protein
MRFSCAVALKEQRNRRKTIAGLRFRHVAVRDRSHRHHHFRLSRDMRQNAARAFRIAA